ncbi:hypothetical protein [Microbulbifer sp. JMSA008]|uniref:hypothetical protein n=1 Tax=Microbulbifer sp. JMSA008 TaxID=3243373 RepID=UPI0040395120
MIRKIKKISIALIALVSIASLCFAMSPGGKTVGKKINESDIGVNIKQGMSLVEVKSYLDENSVKYFVEQKGNIIQLAFTIDDGSKGSGLSAVEKYILFTVKFGDDSLVYQVEKQKAYKGL